jgi:hypothetical protein
MSLTDAPHATLETMLAALLANGARTIIVESPDRFARDLMVQLAGHDALKAQGITLIAASAPTLKAIAAVASVASAARKIARQLLYTAITRPPACMTEEKASPNEPMRQQRVAELIGWGERIMKETAPHSVDLYVQADPEALRQEEVVT